ncbi:MAG: TonB-dependent receptor plug domain-containing protein [candidate division Zixibacteria bacterium]|nr:TonB-dependent receptor plug domain-containing protein [candidate division Zixibacteria bacterium]
MRSDKVNFASWITAKRMLFTSIVLSLLLPCQTYAQRHIEADELLTMTLEELMDVKVTIASKTAMHQRETPGIVTVVTSEEIQNSGAGDLIDVLRLVPGIEMVVDVWGVTGITMRGNIGYAGRVLLMIDGQETNELYHACTFLGNHYPVSNIKRIEIIRGPGSSIYGGFAELGVINIITKTGKDINGISFSTDYGRMAGDASHSNINVSAGKKINDFEFAIHGFYGRGNRSDREYTDVYGNTFDMENQAELNPMLINVAAIYRDLSARFIYDDYVTTTRDWYDEIAVKDYEITYRTLFGELQYDWEIVDKLTLTSKYNFMRNSPWAATGEGASGDTAYYKHERYTDRNRFNLIASFDLSKKVNIITGGEYCRDNAKITILGSDAFWTGKTEIDYSNVSGFAQGIFTTDRVNVTLGGRVDKHSEYGAAFSPRVCLTKVINKSHFKFLYSHSFRAPSISEIDYNYFSDPGKSEPDIEPEKAKVYEFEAGYSFTENMSLIANIYYISVDNSIVFSFGENGEGYDNQGISGTKGFEIEHRVRKNWGYVIFNYSYYSAKDINEVDNYAVDGKDAIMLGTSPHKISFNSSLKLSKRLTINPSFIYMGERYAYTHFDETLDDMVFSTQDQIVLANLYFNYKHVFNSGFDFGIGVYNLLDAEYDFIQPYNGWHPPLPGSSREIIFKLSYRHNLK